MQHLLLWGVACVGPVGAQAILQSPSARCTSWLDHVLHEESDGAETVGAGLAWGFTALPPTGGRIWLVQDLHKPDSCRGSQDTLANAWAQLCRKRLCQSHNQMQCHNRGGERGLQRTAGSSASLCGNRAPFGPALHQQLLGACWRA